MRHSCFIFSYLAIRCWYCCCCSSTRALSVTICPSEAVVSWVEVAKIDRDTPAVGAVALVAVCPGTISVG
uniref:Putative secreted protein n=1 Tax=Anopheles marajoara TaxID=58244 RepID=A0A2M4CEN5_9DIPT